jgi:hypothetical protein
MPGSFRHANGLHQEEHLMFLMLAGGRQLSPVGLSRRQVCGPRRRA